MGTYALEPITLDAIQSEKVIMYYDGVPISANDSLDSLRNTDYVMFPVNGEEGVDGIAALECPGRWINDAWDDDRNNCRSRFKPGGRCEILLTVSVPAHTELCMAYGKAYWLSRLLTLSHSERLRCIRYYSMLPNELSEAGLSGSSMPTISEIFGDSVEMEGHDTRLTSYAVNEQLDDAAPQPPVDAAPQPPVDAAPQPPDDAASQPPDDAAPQPDADEGEPPRKRMRTESASIPSLLFPNGYLTNENTDNSNNLRELHLKLCEGTNFLHTFYNATLPVDHPKYDDRVEEFDYVFEQCTMLFHHFSRIRHAMMDEEIRIAFLSEVSALLSKCNAKLVEYKKSSNTQYDRDDIMYETHRYNLENVFIKSEIIGIWDEMYKHRWHNLSATSDEKCKFNVTILILNVLPLLCTI